MPKENNDPIKASQELKKILKENNIHPSGPDDTSKELDRERKEFKKRNQKGLDEPDPESDN